MNKMDLYESLNSIDEEILHRSETSAIQHKAVKWCSLVATFCIIALCYTLQKAKISDTTSFVTNETEGKIVQNADSPFLSEDDLFSHENISIFEGTITNIEDISFSYEGILNQLSTIDILVTKVISGDCKTSETITILLPYLITDESKWADDSNVISAIKVGSKGIFMPEYYANLYKNVSKYAFNNYIYAFLETENGLIFDKEIYKSFSSITNLNEAETYILEMLRVK